jgi:predicted alpha/beta hydrolase family esterase
MRLIRACIAVAMLAIALPAVAQALPEPIEHVSYGPNPADWQSIYPAESPGAPTVLLAPEGGWHEVGFGALKPEAANLLHYPVDSLTEPAFPLEPEAIRLAAEWAKANGTAYNANPRNVVLVGGSAGGQLVTIVGEKLLPPGSVQGIVSLSGPMNLVARAEEEAHSLMKALGCPTFAECSETLGHEWSPVDNVKSCIPMLLFGSETDKVPLSQQEEMVAAMDDAGCPVTLVVEPKGHAFAYRARANPLIFAFIRAH